jgi:chorismate synthase
VEATGVPPGLGSYAEKRGRLDGRLAAALMGIQAVKGVEIGHGFALARLRGSEAHDEIEPDRRRGTNRAGGLEAGVSNGEPIVIRAAMKPLPTLMRPLRSVDLESGEAGQALVERSDVQAVEALAVVAEAAVAWELARAAREKFGGDALEDFVGAHARYVERIGWRTP